MISIKGLSIKLGKDFSLDNISFTFPHYGMFAICGNSGCGKTTLLNCIAGLLKYSGEVCIDGSYVNRYNESELDKYRLQNIGMVFQDFKLFSFDSIEEYILFPLEVLNNESQKRKKRKANDLIELVELRGREGSSIDELSGGEKQRVAIARALINDPKIVLADEPTGSLDSTTSREIMDLLNKVSKNHLVIIVSHDKDLVNEYADQVVYLKDGKIEKIDFNEKHIRTSYLPISKTRISNKKPVIPLSFLIKHSKTHLRRQKWRSIICNMVNSLSLIGVGIAFSLSSLISNNIKNVYSSVIEDNKIVVSVKDYKESKTYTCSDFESAKAVAAKYPEYVTDIGVLYAANFEEMFIDNDEMVLLNGSIQNKIKGISSRNINEFKWLDILETNIYPREINTLENDEVILTLNSSMIRDICYTLGIKNSVSSLSDYISINSLYFYFNLANNSWDYSDQQLFKIKGFNIGPEGGIIHSNHLWNEYVFEELLRFPYINDFNITNLKPWTLIKTYYLEIRNGIDNFLECIHFDPDFENRVFEIVSNDFCPWMYKTTPYKDRTRIQIFDNKLNQMPLRLGRIINDLDDSLYCPIYGSKNGYAIYPEFMMMGFSKMAYFSSSKSLNEETVDALSYNRVYTNASTLLPDGVLCGHYSKTLQNSVIFQEIDEKLEFGDKPNTFDEIAISSKMAVDLFGVENATGKTLHCAFTTKETIYQTGEVNRTFSLIELKITGIVKSSRYSLFHDSYWTYGFYQSRLGFSSFDLGINSISFSVRNEKRIEKIIGKIQKAFPQYDVVSPMQDINESVGEICTYIQFALIIFSSTSIIISILLLTICNYLHAKEVKRDIGLVRCLGVNKNESRKLIHAHSFLLCLISFGLSSIELTIINFITSLEMSNLFGGTLNIGINPLSYIAMFVISMGIGILSSLFISKKDTSISAIESLKS